MSGSRSKRVVYNIFSEGIYQIVIFVCAMILPRYVLKYYGSEYNGILSSISQFLQFISILRLGVAGATRVELYKSLGMDDIRKTSGIIKATQLFMRRIAYVLCGYILLLMVVFPLILKTRYSWQEIASLVVIMGMITFAEYFFGITNSTLLDSDQRTYVYVWIRTAASIINVFLSVYLMLHGASIQLMKFGSSLVFVASPLFLHFYVRHHYKLDSTIEPDTSALDKRGDVVASSIANTIHDNTDVVVLTLLTSPMVVSVYAVYQLVMNGLKKVLTVFTNGLEAYFGSMWVKKEIENLYVGLNHFEYFVSIYISVVFSSTLVLILPFVSMYTDGVNDINYVIPQYAVLAVVAQAVLCFRQPYLTFVQAAGHYKETKHGAYMEAIINILLSVFLTYIFGIIGVVIGTLVANLFRSIQYAYYISKNLLPRPFSKVLGRMVWSFCNVIIAAGLIKMIYQVIGLLFTTWSAWLFGAIIAVISATILCGISSFIFYRNDMRWLFKKTTSILIRRRRG